MVKDYMHLLNSSLQYTSVNIYMCVIKLKNINKTFKIKPDV